MLTPARRLRFALVADALETFAAGRPLDVLDAGCGDGALAVRLARRHPEWQVTGADLDDALLERARGAAARSHASNAHFVRADLTGDLGSAAYDAVASVEALEEIEADADALRSLVAALRPGGLLVLHVPERAWRPVFPRTASTWRNEVRHGYAAAELRSRVAALGVFEIRVDASCRTLVRGAQELCDLAGSARPTLRAALATVLAPAAALERRWAWGRGRALLLVGRRLPAAV